MFIYLFHKWEDFVRFESERVKSYYKGMHPSPDFGAQIMLGYLLFCQLLIYEVVLTL